ncbi:MAG: flagellar motor protein MotB [Desulfovibrio sp. S3730MH75]|nr:MAG: flagellar motor protein MotB [Desulfovibrio sp. S3730MH75]
MSDDFVLKKKNKENNDLGWALTLADMMMLLLCFFVMLIAIADIDESKYENVSDSLASAMGVKIPPKGETQVKSKTVEDAPVARRTISREQRNLFAIQLEMSRLIGRETDALKIKLRSNSVAIVLKGDVFFGLGKADLTKRASNVLARIAPTLAKSPYDIVVEGHSDNIPMSSKQFPSNWELSSARASAVARFLLKNGFDKSRLAVQGMADTNPMWPNMDENGKAIAGNQRRNRRVTLLIYPPKKAAEKQSESIFN